ncbi:MAG: tRNA pseudouridine(13) synthase TruD [archaeon]
MKYILSPDTFEVKEIFNPQLISKGLNVYYLVEKKGLSHKQLLKRLPKDAYFCGVKDRNATTKQWMSSQQVISDINEKNLKLKLVGYSDKKIYIGLHKGNAFTVKVEFSREESAEIKNFKAKNEYVCNYFGEQRFSENTIEICKALEEKNYEKALKLFLTKKGKFDSDKSRAMKKIIEENWGNWKRILEDEEIKGTGKVVLFEYLEKNPSNFENAFLHTEEKSTKTLIKAAQALRFNKELNKLAEKKKPNNIKAQIAGLSLLIGASKAFPRKITINPTEFEKKFRKSDLERRTFFTADKFRAKLIKGNEFEISFELGRGIYATVFLKYLEAWLKNKINKG